MREINKKSMASIWRSKGLKKINSFDFKRTIRMEMGKIITNTEKLYFINFLRFFIHTQQVIPSNPLFTGFSKKFVSSLYKRYFIFYPLFYEYAYKIGISYKVCIRRLYNF